MDRKCWRLEAQDVWLGLKVDKLFTTKKEAEEYFHTYCMGCGIITKVRAIDKNRKFYSSMEILSSTKVKILKVNE